MLANWGQQKRPPQCWDLALWVEGPGVCVGHGPREETQSRMLCEYLHCVCTQYTLSSESGGGVCDRFHCGAEASFSCFPSHLSTELLESLSEKISLFFHLSSWGRPSGLWGMATLTSFPLSLDWVPTGVHQPTMLWPPPLPHICS